MLGKLDLAPELDLHATIILAHSRSKLCDDDDEDETTATLADLGLES